MDAELRVIRGVAADLLPPPSDPSCISEPTNVTAPVVDEKGGSLPMFPSPPPSLGTKFVRSLANFNLLNTTPALAPNPLFTKKELQRVVAASGRRDRELSQKQFVVQKREPERAHKF